MREQEGRVEERGEKLLSGLESKKIPPIGMKACKTFVPSAHDNALCLKTSR